MPSDRNTLGIGPKRRCKRCGLRRDAHVIDGKCADGGVYVASQLRLKTASNSFTDDEVDVLLALLKNARTGYDSRNLARLPAYANLARKAQAMRVRIDAVETERAGEIAGVA